MKRVDRQAAVACVLALASLGTAASTTYAQIPVGSNFQVNSYTTLDQYWHSMAAAAGGGFVVVWTSDRQLDEYLDIFGQRFDADGVAVGSEFQVNTFTTESQSDPDVAVDGAGNFVVVWQ